MEAVLSTVSLALLIFSVVMIALNALIGARRGALRSAIRAVLRLLSIPIAVWIAKPIAAAIGRTSAEMVQSMLSSEMDLSMLEQSGDSITNIIVTLTTILIAPTIFFSLHWLVSLLTRIADKPLKKLLEDRDIFPDGAVSKLLGALFGAVCGILILTTFFSPFTGYLDIANRAAAVESVDGQTPLSPICDSAVVKTNRALGGKWLFNSLTSTRYKGERVRLVDEADTVIELYSCFVQLVDVPTASWGDDQATQLRHAADTFDNSVLISDTAATLIADACGEWSRGATYMDMAKPEVPELLAPTMDLLYETLAKSTPDTFRKNVHTFAEIACAMIEHNVFETIADAANGETDETAAYLSVLTNQAFTDAVIDALYNDEQLRVLIPEIVNLSLRAIAYTMELPADKNDLYNRILQDTTAALQSSVGLPDIERMVLLGDELYGILTGYGVDISPTSAASMAVGMIVDFAADLQINPDDIAAWFAEYATATAAQKAEQQTQSIEPTLIPLGTDNDAPVLVLLSGTQRTFAGAKAAAAYIAQQNACENAYQILTIEHDGAASYRFVSMSGGSIRVYDSDGVQLSISPSIAGTFTVAENGEFTAVVCDKGWTLIEKPRRVTAEELAYLIGNKLSPLPEGYTPVVAATDSTAVSSSKLQNAQNQSITVTDINSLILSINAAANHELACGQINTDGTASLASADQLQSCLPCRSDMSIPDVAGIAQSMSREDALTVSTALSSVATLLTEGTSGGASNLVDSLLSDPGADAMGAIMDSMTALSGSDEQAKNTLLAGASFIGADIVALKNALDDENTSASAVAGNLLSSAGTIVSLTDESLTTEEKIARISSMLTNLDEGSARAIAAAVSPSMLSDMGLPASVSSTFSSLVSSTFLTLADAKANGMSEEQFDREADALSAMFKLATTLGSGDNGGDGAFGPDGVLGYEADELLDLVTTSNMLSNALLTAIGSSNGAYFTASNPNPLGIGSLSEKDEQALLSAIEQAERTLSSYPNSTGELWSPANNVVTRQDMARRLFAFASIFGLEYESDLLHVN